MSRLIVTCPSTPWMRPDGSAIVPLADERPVPASTMRALHEEAHRRLRLVPYAEAARKHGHDRVTRLIAEDKVKIVDGERAGETLISLTAIEKALAPRADDAAADEVIWPGGRQAWGQPERRPR